MRLKNIKLAGFKSFVDPTTASFVSNLTAVVGPNGCGKSNIIDAVRWVMGESSARYLRGESMADVIFNGSSARKPVAQASVELIFENDKGRLTGEYAAFNEISVRRQVTRDGQSQYFLNGARCRRRDITDLFLGTGLGPRSYAIIEQGMISRLIEARPEELRVYIEEAAGISRYKERRRETENRMRRTFDNIERLTDIREELDRQLERLARQAAAAERYKVYQQEEKQLSAQLLAIRWRGLQEQEGALRIEVAEVERSLAEEQRRYTEQEAIIESHRDTYTAHQESVDEAQQHYYTLGADVARLEQQLQHQRQRQRQLEKDLADANEAWQKANSDSQHDKQQLQQWQTQLEERLPAWQELEEKLAVCNEQLAAAEHDGEQSLRSWEQFQQQASQRQRDAEILQSRIQHWEESLTRLERRWQRLEAEQQELNSASLMREVAELEAQAAVKEEQALQAEEQLATQQALQQRTREQQQVLEQAVAQARKALQEQQGKLTTLQALQEAAMDDGDLGAWKAEHGYTELPTLAAQLTVAPQWEKAVETVLQHGLQGVYADLPQGLTEQLHALPHGHLWWWTSSASPAPEGTLAAQVQGPAPLLLHSIYTAPNMAAAWERRHHLAQGESVITPEGLWLGPDWLHLQGAEQDEAGLLARERDLRALTATVAEQEEALIEQEEQLALQREQLSELEEQRETAQQALALVHREYTELSAQAGAKALQVEQVQQRLQRLEEEQQDIAQQREEEFKALKAGRVELEAMVESMAADTAERGLQQEEREMHQRKISDLRQQVRQYREQHHQLAIWVEGARTNIHALEQSLARLQGQVEHLVLRKNQLELQLGTDSEPDTVILAQLEEVLERRLEAEELLQQRRRDQDTVAQQLRQAETVRNTAEQASQKWRETLSQTRMKWQEVMVRRQTVEEQLTEAGFHLETLIRNLPEDFTEEKCQAEREAVANRISRLGQINLAAIDEHKVQSERKAFLDMQNDDLTQALETLENAIKKIDRETRARFKTYFDKINAGLQELFPKVFGGGSASLTLTGEDLLDTGVAIMARPPGKRNSTIHLLSGGEKALTALSLVFAIFQLNPAPFCMLDEVDAPLDDANVGRFCNLVHEMSSMVQFVFITHNKITMEMADVLMGVTMHEPGVSRLVSVDVEKAVELAAQ
ncbi:MAG TPA: chromosome segregation protein SMC [Alcanivoracaceae bacterium]|nr:chromosome segregation protein SMC [Alcanivoracaceae bacterium]